MKYSASLLLSICMCILNVHAAQENFHSLPTRDGAEQPIWLVEPDNPSHIVILFAGGKGKLKITGDGIRKEGNFLVRTREMFVERGMAAVVVDKPSDREGLFLFRKTREHVQDIKTVINFIRKRMPNIPLWLVGTSRGTISVANAAASIKGSSSPQGIVLTSTVTQQSNRGLDSLEDIDLSKITAPTLIVHHEEDGCYVTPYDGARDLMQTLDMVKIKAFKEFSGGYNEGNPCKGKSYHGFLGIEKQVITSIVDWIKSH